MASVRMIREMERKERLRRERIRINSVIVALWYGAWALMLWSIAVLLFMAQVMAERLIFLGLIALGIVMLFYTVSWALILGTYIV